MSWTALIARWRASFLRVLCGAFFTLWGCGTSYVASEPRPVRVGELEASIERLPSRLVAEVRVTGPAGSPATIPAVKNVRLGAITRPPCASGQLLWDPEVGPPQPVNGKLRVKLPGPIADVSLHGLTVDLAFEDKTSTCLRLPLTIQGDEILWHASGGWPGTLLLGVEWPTGAVAGIGAAFTAEVRFHRRVRLAGTWRLALGLPMGIAGCRRGCPPEALVDGSTGVAEGSFLHIGATASVARGFEVGPWMVLPTLGYRASTYFLQAPTAWEGDRFALLAGPFLGIGLLRALGDRPPGFDPPPTARAGFMLTVSALRAHDRAPEGTTWMLGLSAVLGEE